LNIQLVVLLDNEAMFLLDLAWDVIVDQSSLNSVHLIV